MSVQFKIFWQQVQSQGELIKYVQEFEDSVRRFVCHVICITYQTIEEEVLGEAHHEAGRLAREVG